MNIREEINFSRVSKAIIDALDKVPDFV